MERCVRQWTVEQGGRAVGISGRTTRPQNHEELEESWLLPLWACGKNYPNFWILPVGVELGAVLVNAILL